MQNIVKKIRHSKGLTRLGLSAKTGINPTTLLRIENYNYLPSEYVRARLVRALNVSELDLFPQLQLAATEVVG